MKRIVIAAGGTGGHFYPGLVIAKALRDKGWKPLMVIKTGDPAMATLEREGLASLPVDLRGMPRKIGSELITFAGRLVSSIGLLSRTLRDFSPNLAVGMGGYLTFPLAIAARRRGVPLAVHESNSILGLANDASRRVGARLFWGLPPDDSSLGGTLVGTPVRPALWTRADAAKARAALGLQVDQATILAFGGSQGAQGINVALAEALRALGGGVQVLHLAGRGKAEETRAAYGAAGVAADVREYLDDMGAAYAAADLVICRSGASTLAELAAQRLASILIPYPHATANHQDANARAFERVGAALRLPESTLKDTLPQALQGLVTDLDAAKKRESMSAAFGRLGLPKADAAVDRIVHALEEMAAP